MATQKVTVKKNGGNMSKMALAAASVAAAAGAAYFLAGAKRRTAIKSWAVKAKADVLEKIEGLKAIDAETYVKIVDDVVARYKKLNKVSAGELADLAKELKGHWNTIAKQLNAKGRSATKKNPSTPRKIAKK